MLSLLAMRLGGAAVAAGVIIGGWLYVQHLRDENKRLEASNASLIASAKITFRQQEISDRASLELQTLRAKSQEQNRTLISDVSMFMRDACPGVPTTADHAAGTQPARAESGPSTIAQVADLCAKTAVESDERGDQVTKIQEWYEKIRKARD